jgi:hypothetical protein
MQVEEHAARLLAMFLPIAVAKARPVFVSAHSRLRPSRAEGRESTRP